MTKRLLTQRWAGSLSERCHRNVAASLSASLPSQALRASSPKGRALGEEGKPHGISKASPFGSNSDDRRQRRKQGVAVGAAASRMRARAKQTLGAATRAVSPKVTERASPWRKGCSHSDGQALCQSDVIATWLRHCQHPCPLRRSAPALPKGEPLQRVSFTFCYHLLLYQSNKSKL